ALRSTGRVGPGHRLFRPGADSFLEGPAFDRHGALYVVDILNGRVLCVTPVGGLDVVAEYDGEPNGLAIHEDGRLFIADYRRGLLTLEPRAGRLTPLLADLHGQPFHGLNDLVFARNGDLYFTDQGQTGLQDPRGRLCRLTVGGRLDVILDNVPSPNGVALSPDETLLYLAVTRANAIWRVPLLPEGRPARVGVFLQLSGGLAGPDGLAVDDEGNVAVAHAGLGVVWVFDRLGQPLYRIDSCRGLMTTNVSWFPGRRTIYITESETGSILQASLPGTGAARREERA
ncbi:MAG: SMP-30/gluconolactonase/LRE family protein, partial [Candidatus Rokubacteria bacterium]|nr:SMP-30/gluconolactonase/LRE family protein [Candidatus Rokubacteria bacterium]